MDSLVLDVLREDDLFRNPAFYAKAGLVVAKVVNVNEPYVKKMGPAADTGLDAKPERLPAERKENALHVGFQMRVGIITRTFFIPLRKRGLDKTKVEGSLFGHQRRLL
jgi:hypothetical protein